MSAGKIKSRRARFTTAQKHLLLADITDILTFSQAIKPTLSVQKHQIKRTCIRRNQLYITLQRCTRRMEQARLSALHCSRVRSPEKLWRLLSRKCIPEIH